MDISSFCTPAIVYLVIAVLGFLTTITKSSVMSMISSAIFIFLWTWFLNFLCSKGYTGISWFLVVFPFILMLLILAFVFEVAMNAHATHEPKKTEQQPSKK